MKIRQAEFYIQAIDLYIKKGVPQKNINEVVKLASAELSLLEADDLSKPHVDLMEKLLEQYVDQEDFVRARVMRDQIQNSLNIFEARDNHLKKLLEIRDKQNKEKDE